MREQSHTDYAIGYNNKQFSTMHVNPSTSSSCLYSQEQNCSQHCNIEELSQLSNVYKFSQKPFLIMHTNIRSLQKNFEKLQELLCDIIPTPDLIAVSETWYNNTSFFNPVLPNYQFFSSSLSCNRAGGVAIFLRNSFNFQIRSDIKLSTEKCEDLWIEVSGLNKRAAIIGVIYRHPGCSIKTFQKNFETLIFNLSVSRKPVYIVGDFNINVSDGSNYEYINSISSLGYHQFVKSPTRYNSNNNSSSIIDHFYSNQSQNNIQVKILISDISDHFPLLAWIGNPCIKNNRPKKISCRDMKSFSAEAYNEDLYKEMSNLSIGIDSDVNELFDSFTKILMKVIDTHAPYRELTRRESKRKQKPWLTKKLLKLTKIKNRLYRKSTKNGNTVL